MEDTINIRHAHCHEGQLAAIRHTIAVVGLLQTKAKTANKSSYQNFVNLKRTKQRRETKTKVRIVNMMRTALYVAVPFAIATEQLTLHP